MSAPRRRTAPAGTVVAYLRVSTEEQHLGPEAQREAQRAEDQRRAQVAQTQSAIERIYSDPAREAEAS